MNIGERLVSLETEMRYMRKLMGVVIIILIAQLGVEII